MIQTQLDSKRIALLSPHNVQPVVLKGRSKDTLIFQGSFRPTSEGDYAVLNLAREFPLTFAPESGISSKHLELTDGAQHPIPEEVLLEAIAGIEEQLQQGKKKVLINCRAGIGRSGSVSLAYCFYKHRMWSYQQTLDYIWSKKSDIYPHSHLQESLERLFPREKREN